MNILGSWLGQSMSIETIVIIVLMTIVLIWWGVGKYKNNKFSKKKSKGDKFSRQTGATIKNPIRDDRDVKSTTKSNREENNDGLDTDLITREIINPIATYTFDKLKEIKIKGVIYKMRIDLSLQTPEGEEVREIILVDEAQFSSKKGISGIKLPETAIGIEVEIYMRGSATGSTKTISSYKISGKFRGNNRNPDGYWKVAPYMDSDKPLWTGIHPYNLDSALRAVEKASDVMKKEGEDAIGMEVESAEEKINTSKYLRKCLSDLIYTFSDLSRIENGKIGNFYIEELNDAPDRIGKLRKACWEAAMMTEELDFLLKSLEEETQNAIKISQEMERNDKIEYEAFRETIKKAKGRADALNEMITPLL